MKKLCSLRQPCEIYKEFNETCWVSQFSLKSESWDNDKPDFFLIERQATDSSPNSQTGPVTNSWIPSSQCKRRLEICWWTKLVNKFKWFNGFSIYK